MRKQIDLKSRKPRLAYIGMGKKMLVEAVPTQVVEVVYPSKAHEEAKELKTSDTQEALFTKGELQEKVSKSSELPKNRLIWTNDNIVALKTLLDEKDSVTGEYKYRNKIDLIYIDPPFMVQDDFVAQNSIDIEIDEEEGVVSVKEPTIIETIAYKDTWQNGLDSFLQMMRERLDLMKELLSPSGFIFVHLDWHTTHYVKVLMDELFGYENLRNEIILPRPFTKNLQQQFESIKSLNVGHDTLLFYSTNPETTFPLLWVQKQEVKNPEGHWHHFWSNADRPTMRYELFGITPQSGQWIWNKEKALKAIKNYEKFEQEANSRSLLQYWNDTGQKLRFLRKDDEGKPQSWRPPSELQLATTLWSDVQSYENQKDYPTQKHENLLTRIVECFSKENDLVLDAFVGSGTTLISAEKINRSWIGIDNSKFAIHTARKRLIELNGKPKGKKGEGMYKVQPFTVENMGYYQRGMKWDPIQVSEQADAYRKAIIELFGGEYSPYSKLLHGKKRGSWVHVGPLSAPIIAEQIQAIAKEVKDTEFKKVYVLSADFTAHHQRDIDKIKGDLDVQVMVRLIPASAIEEVKHRLELMRQGAKEQELVSEMPSIAFFAPLTVKVNSVVDGKEVMIELAGLEVDAESFLESQKPERREELKKWLEQEKSWQSFVDFWAVDWDYQDLNGGENEPIFENEWQSFRKRNGKKFAEDLVFKAFYTYEKPSEYTIAVKVTDVFGNDGIITRRVAVK